MYEFKTKKQKRLYVQTKMKLLKDFGMPESYHDNIKSNLQKCTTETEIDNIVKSLINNNFKWRLIND